MAIWEYRCTVVPKAKLNVVVSLTPESMSNIDSLALWSGLQISEMMQYLPLHIERKSGWTSNLTIVQIDSISWFEIYAEKNEVLNVEIFLDLRFPIQSLLKELGEICTQQEWILIDDEARILSHSMI